MWKLAYTATLAVENRISEFIRMANEGAEKEGTSPGSKMTQGRHPSKE